MVVFLAPSKANVILIVAVVVVVVVVVVIVVVTAPAFASAAVSLMASVVGNVAVAACNSATALSSLPPS